MGPDPLLARAPGLPPAGNAQAALRSLLLVLLLVLLGSCGRVKPEAPPRPGPEAPAAGRQTVPFENDAVRGYLAQLPQGYSPGGSYPLIVVFHGAMGSADTAYERWSDGLADFILVCPQGTARMGWQLGTGQLDSILACIDDVQERFAVDPERVYLTGHSMGGHVSWNLATYHAERFAAVAPTASAPMYPDDLDGLLGLPLYVVHGRRDGIVDLASNQRAEDYVNAHGGTLTLTVVENAGHGFVADQRDAIIEFFGRHRR